MTVTTPRRQRSMNLQRATMTLDPASVAAVDSLVDSGLFLSRSDAVDRALKLLISAYCDAPNASDKSELAVPA